MRPKRVDISSLINCQDSILCPGTRSLYKLYSFQNVPLLFVRKQHRNISSSELFGKSTPVMFTVFKMVHQCYFECWRGTVGTKLPKSICSLQRMRCLQGKRRSHALHSPCSPAESLADAAELRWLFHTRANSHSVFPGVQMTCGHAGNWEWRDGDKSRRAQ